VFYQTVKQLFSPTSELLQQQCSLAKEEMKTKDAEELGSWSQAVTASDGAWLIRGAFSQNFTDKEFYEWSTSVLPSPVPER